MQNQRLNRWLNRWLNRCFGGNRANLAVALSGLTILGAYVAALQAPLPMSATEQLLVGDPWYCEVPDPSGPALVARSVETYHQGGRFEGLTRLVDREAGQVLLEFSYQGVWQFEDPWLTEAIEDYQYLQVDDGAFSADELAAIEAEFGEPDISRVHAMTRGQMVYGGNQALYQCHRRPGATLAAADVGLRPSASMY